MRGRANKISIGKPEESSYDWLWAIGKTVIGVVGFLASRDVALKFLDKPAKVSIKRNDTEVSFDRGDHLKEETPQAKDRD